MQVYEEKKLKLIILEYNSQIKIITLDKNAMEMGRGDQESDCDILLNSSIVSHKHGCFFFDNGSYYYIDYPNLNGTYYNEIKISKEPNENSSPIKLSDGDVLRIDSFDLDSPTSNGVVIIIALNNSDEDIWKVFPMKTIEKELLIGRRVPEGNIILPKPMISKLHAKIICTPQGYVLGDCKSANGTLLNGILVKEPILLRPKDIISICSSKLIYTGDMLIYNIPKSRVQPGVELKINGISKDIIDRNGQKRRILNNISLTIHPGELVAIIGASGAGKTTFMNAISGFERATEGTVYMDDTDLYENYEIHKTQIGYVPQNDIVHDKLTVQSMLKYVAKLRLPRDINKDEIDFQVNFVMEIMGLKMHKEKLIRKLSGGQRKRASIASELISEPAILFMDEPTSGLDPEADINLIKHLKQLTSVEGKTIIVITHTLQNIHIFDKVVFLAQGGRLAFFGSYKDALEFFEVDNLVDVYEKISTYPEFYIRKYKEMTIYGDMQD